LPQALSGQLFVVTEHVADHGVITKRLVGHMPVKCGERDSVMKLKI